MSYRWCDGFDYYEGSDFLGAIAEEREMNNMNIELTFFDQEGKQLFTSEYTSALDWSATDEAVKNELLKGQRTGTLPYLAINYYAIHVAFIASGRKPLMVWMGAL